MSRYENHLPLPTSFYEHLGSIGNFRVNAVCAGIPRSATTMVWQVVRDAFPEGGVVKTHSFLDVPDDIPVVATVRDMRDACVSWWRSRYADEQQRNAREIAARMGPLGAWQCIALQDDECVPHRMSREEMLNTVAAFKSWMLQLDQYARFGKRVLVLKYEDFAATNARLKYDATSLAEEIANHIGRDVLAKDVEKHGYKHNLGLKRYTDVPVYGWDHVHATQPVDGGHCHEGEVGIHEPFTDVEIRREMVDLLSPELMRYGYL